ncbi:hypothetical protein NEDG_00078 [Nematocida displodere]|uniref:Uncharacterized protein n=1 Tax=Nematocida displodere TaxID=1805483 RepID=A0A177EI00_9MICR|nr:hypothetical protein NEDG_00078 [Nematocida displodere]
MVILAICFICWIYRSPKQDDGGKELLNPASPNPLNMQTKLGSAPPSVPPSAPEVPEAPEAPEATEGTEDPSSAPEATEAIKATETPSSAPEATEATEAPKTKPVFKSKIPRMIPSDRSVQSTTPKKGDSSAATTTTPRSRIPTRAPNT